MTYRKEMKTLTIILLLALPLIGLGILNSVAEPTVWVISAEGYDGNVDLATTTLLHEIAMVDCIVKTTTFERLDTVPFHSDVLVLVGHGQPDGLEVSDTILPWSNLYDEIAERRPGKTIVLACHSPTDLELNVVGFSGLIDAEAGALLTAWHVQRSVDPGSQKTLPLGRVIDAQRSMLHPLNRYVYFVHGYFGNSSDFEDMSETLWLRGYLETYNEVRYFSYFSAYGATTESEKIAVHCGFTISDFAIDFANELLSLPVGSQVNIVSHSLGGVIVREMLRLKRTDLDTHGINFGQIITMGTPNAGTWLADPLNNWAYIVSLIPWLLYGDVWPSPVFWSLCPGTSFMNTLNADPSSYSDGIRFTTAAAQDLLGLLLTDVHHGNALSDPVVTVSSVHSIDAWNQTTFYYMNHNNLVNDEFDGRRTYNYVGEWLNYGIDSDGDGLLDDEESYYYGTNPDLYDTDCDGLSDSAEWYTYNTDPLDSDSDNDGLSDGAEVISYGTNPLNWNTDGDSIGDGNEVSWGYNPLNANDPVPASLLIYKAWQSTGTTGYVRVNHYTAMDYVKVYVKYKSSSGYWTSYIHVGTDYTPSYYGDYYVSWTLIQGYVQMKVQAKAYDSSNHYLGSDYWYVSLPDEGGGGPWVPF